MWNENISTYYSSSSSRFKLHQKRKGESLMDMPPLKMHINEEKMVSQLKGIHLSNCYTSHGSNSNDSNTSILSHLYENNSKESEPLPSLKICDELKSQFNPSFKLDSAVPTSILDKFNKQCTALVLWQPPMGSIGRTLSSRDQFSNGAEDSESELPSDASSSTSLNRQVLVDVEMMDDDDNNNSVRADVEPSSPNF